MGNPWTNLVKKTFNAGKKVNAMYSLKDAMIESKKVYKTGASFVSTKRSTVVRKKGNKRKTARLKNKNSRRR